MCGPEPQRTVYHHQEDYPPDLWRQQNPTFGHRADWSEWCEMCARAGECLDCGYSMPDGEEIVKGGHVIVVSDHAEYCDCGDGNTTCPVPVQDLCGPVMARVRVSA